MPYYSYLSVTALGKKVKGSLEAPTPEEAKQRLQDQGVIILSLKRCNKAARRARLKHSERVEFIGQLAALLQTGMPLYESLCELSAQHLEEPHYPTLTGLSEQIKRGASLADAMRYYPESFSDLMIATIDAGQASGRLPQTLNRVAAMLQVQQKRGKQFLTALLYPTILLAFSSLLIVVLLTYVIPSLEVLFAERQVNILTRFVIGMSHFFRFVLPWLLPVFALGGFFTYRYFRTSKGKWKSEQLMLCTPILKTVLIKRELGQFAHLMHVMLEGGVPLLQSLEIARRSLSLQIIKEEFAQAEKKVIEGRLLSQELKNSKRIPPLFSRLLAIGEEGGNAPEMFKKIAEFYELEVDKALNRLTALAQPVLLLIMGGIVGVIMLAVLLPLTDVNAFI